MINILFYVWLGIAQISWTLLFYLIVYGIFNGFDGEVWVVDRSKGEKSFLDFEKNNGNKNNS